MLDSIARESLGNPFFVHELVRVVAELAQKDDDLESVGKVSLAAVLERRVGELPMGARRALEIVSVAGRPLPLNVVQRATELTAEDRERWFAMLQSAQLVRLSGRRNIDLIEPYHDRIREAVVAMLSAEVRRRHHLQLARTIETSDYQDPESLVLHYRAAGESALAAQSSAAGTRRWRNKGSRIRPG